VYDRPANTFVAGFIGSPPMNMTPGTVEDDGAIRTPGGMLRCAPVPGVAGGDAVTVGIRPEHLRLGGSLLRGTVANVEMLGHERHVLVKVGDAVWTVRDTTDEAAVTAGSEVGLDVDLDRLHLFSPHDGQRITAADRPPVTR
jgi:multiple sugar transport system ATP-binding protein